MKSILEHNNSLPYGTINVLQSLTGLFNVYKRHLGCFLLSEFLIPFKFHLFPQFYRKRDNCEVFGHNEGCAITKGIYTLLQIISCKHRNYVKTPQHETRLCKYN
jgi:hypothetical protein